HDQLEMPVPEREVDLPEPPRWLLAFFELLLWVLVGVAALLLGAGLLRHLVRGGRHSGRQAASTGEEGAPTTRPVSSSLGDAHALAREGRHGEAIHALLLCTIAEMRARLGFDAEIALTGREIAAAAPVGPRGSAALHDLVRTVEISLFGGATVGREDYDSCVARFHELIDECQQKHH
ncbi:MAG: DUF4129 domain-containing protein, partial [Planctomycetota bacterium]